MLLAVFLRPTLNKINSLKRKYITTRQTIEKAQSEYLKLSNKNDGFCGRMTAAFECERTTKNLLGLLFEYANYSGIGIKTAIGMGAIKSNVK